MGKSRGSKLSSRTRTILIAVSLVLIGVVALATVGQGAIANLAASLQGKRMASANTGPTIAKASAEDGGWTPDPYLSKLIIAEQQESREYYRRLAEGQITKIVVLGVYKDKKTGKTVLRLQASFGDLGGDQDFRAEFTKDAGKWFLFQTTQGSALASVANIGGNEEALGRRLLRQQRKNQAVLRDLVNNKIKWLEIRSVDRKLNKSTLDCVLRYRDGSTKRGTIEMQYMSGYWYVVSIKKA